MKVCTGCKIEKPFAHFSKDVQTPSGYKIYCKACASAQHKKWRSDNLDRQRRKDRVAHYQRAYGLTPEVAEALADNRKGVCPICAKEDLLVVDHCHTTGKVRDFICSACNSVLGYSKESQRTLKRAAQYLEKHCV